MALSCALTPSTLLLSSCSIIHLFQAKQNYYGFGGTESVTKQTRRAKLFASEDDDNEVDDAVGVFEAQFLGIDTLESAGKTREEKKKSADKGVARILKSPRPGGAEVVFIKIGIEGIKVRTALSEEVLRPYPRIVLRIPIRATE